MSQSRRQFIRNISLATIGSGGVFAFLRYCTDIVIPNVEVKFDDNIFNTLIKCAFRLTDHGNLLNLEYYFINCQYKPSSETIWAKYGPHENYMVVRLPQQHIAEENFGVDETSFKAATYISNYSYLVFRILFPEENFKGDYNKIKLSKKELLKWDDEKRFRLVVRQDLSQSLFELVTPEYFTDKTAIGINDSLKELSQESSFEKKDNITVDSLKKKLFADSLKHRKQFISNQYPFQKARDSKDRDSSVFKHDLKLVPKVYGDPITAIELPWRLIISPKLPDSRNYKFKWDFPETSIGNGSSKYLQNKLWTVNLSISKKTDDDDDYRNRRNIEEKNNREQLKSSGSLNEVINELELMILGSPDYLNLKAKYSNILPTPAHRKDLVALYIKLRITARTEKLTFSAIGATTKIHFKNDKIEEALSEHSIGLIEWNQIISLGRDEKVEVSTLCLEAEFGHKMAYIQIAERQLINGKYPLIKEEFLMPLDITKDYTIHETQNLVGSDSDNSIISRFKSPFKKITFLETKPKRLLPKGYIYKQDELNQTKTSFEFEAIDWHDNVVRFSKSINALPFGAVIQNNKIDDGVKKILAPEDNKMYSSIENQTKSFSNTTLPVKSRESLLSDLEKGVSSSRKKIKELENIIKSLKSNKDKLEILTNSIIVNVDSISHAYASTEEYLLRIKNYFNEFDELLNNDKKGLGSKIEWTTFLSVLLKRYIPSNQEIFKKIKSIYPFNQETPIMDEKNLYEIVKNILRESEFNEPVIQKGDKDKYEEFYLKISIEFPESVMLLKDLFFLEKLVVSNDENKIFEVISEGIKIAIDLESVAKNIPGLILLQKKKIGYAIEEKLENSIKENSLSQLESDYIIFQGGLREGENQIFDFFNEHAIIPQLTQAKVYVSALNKLVNEEFPIIISYADDYIQNQTKEIEFEINQNVAQVFAKVEEISRQQVKGLIQKMGSKMPGINVEIPAHYLTYAKNQQKILDNSINELKDELGLDSIERISNDLIFISEEVKNAVDTVNDLAKVDPKKYFKDLGAKLFGSIGLEDILDIGFDLPRITEFPDKIQYQVSTDKFTEFRAAFVKFKPNAIGDLPSTKLELFTSRSLKNSREYYAYTKLNNFDVGVVMGGTEILTITFEKYKILSSPNHPKKTDVNISNVKLGGPLEFIASLAEKFVAPGNGMRIRPGPTNLYIDYTIAFTDIIGGAFVFKNLQFIIGVNIPYDPSILKPITFVLGVNKPEDKFLVCSGIYAGRGHFMLTATPRGIEQIDIAMELGAYASINLGIGKGEVFLFFGFWFISGEKLGQSYVKAVAYVICSGSATVLGFISIGVSVLISLTYTKRGDDSVFFGQAIVTYSVKVGFFKKKFRIKYYKEISGNSKGSEQESKNTASIVPNLNWGLNNDSENKKLTFTDVYKSVQDFKVYLNCYADN